NYVLSRLDHLQKLAGDMDRTEARVGLPSMSRKFRRLQVPEEGKVVTRFGSNTTEITLTRAPGNEYTGTFKQLDEGTLEYWAVAKDARTAKRKLTVLPPPTVKSLLVTEERPAYLDFSTNVNPDLVGAGLGGPLSHTLSRDYSALALTG